jgi:DNA repair protein RadA/Sms
LSCDAGLGGELRAVSHIERRLIEAAKLGFTAVVLPAAHSGPVPTRAPGLQIIPCRTVTDALAAVLGSLPADTPPKKGRGSQEAEEGDDFDDVA